MREKSQGFENRQVMKNDSFEIFHYKEPKISNVEVHDHDFYEVYFLLNGDVSYWVEGQVYNLEPGDLLLINPLVLHRPIVLENSKVYERIVLWINKKYLEEMFFSDDNLSNCFKKVKETKNCLIKISNEFELSDLTSNLAKLVHEYYGDEFANKMYAQSVFIQFMIELNRIVNKSKVNKLAAHKQSRLVSDVLKYIDLHYNKEISLDELAQNFFVSKYHLSHEFSKEVGTGVYRYIMLKRLTVAKQMLNQGIQATDVCFKCGFKDYTNFYRAFKSEYGISPKYNKNSF